MKYMKIIIKKMKEDYYYYIIFLGYLEVLFFFVVLEINYKTGLNDVTFFLIFIPIYSFFLFYVLDLHIVKTLY
jgi:hypothetical protein